MGKKLLKVHRINFDGADLPFQWYTVLVNFNHEYNAIKNIINTAAAKGQGLKIAETFIPIREYEEKVERKLKSGLTKVKVVKKKEHLLEGGYVFIKCKMDNEMWNIIRQSSGVAGYLNADGQPAPVPDEDVEKLKAMVTPPTEEQAEETVTVDFKGKVGDVVKISKYNLEAVIERIDRTKSSIKAVAPNGTPLEVNMSEVEVVNI